MHPLHVPILLVLLLIPNTTWHDWRDAKAPHLQQVLSTGEVALMNDRTAEEDAITPEAGLRTFMAGARMNFWGDPSKLDYPVAPHSLPQAFSTAGISVNTTPDLGLRVIGGEEAEPPNGFFDVEELPTDSAQADGQICVWQAKIEASGGALVIASSNPSPREYREFDRLTPIVVWQPGGEPGILYSSSTRHAGLITNTDVAPTLAALAGVKLAGPTYGAAAVEAARAQSWEARSELLDQLDAASRKQAQAQLVTPYFAVAVAILIGCAILLKLRNKLRASMVLVILVTGSVVYLITFSPINPAPAFFSLLALAAAWYFERIGVGPYRRVLPGALIGAIILLDALLDRGSITASSLLGYSLEEGARYYGLGNEAMGIIIGAATVTTSALAGKRQGLLAGSLIWIGLAIVLGLPTIGAKVGGLLVALIALAGFLSANRGQVGSKAAWIRYALYILPPALAIGGLALFSRLEASHLSGTVGQVRQFGGGVIWSVIYRKAAMDLHLTIHSAWMLVLIAALAGTWLLSTRLAGRNSPTMRSVLITGYTATAACFLLNDAGVVAAALCAIFPWIYVTASPTLIGWRRPQS